MLRIIFMGTPDFATACLKKLVETGNDVIGVVTQPDKAMGRGMKMGFSDVKKYALEKELPIFQPTTLKDSQVRMRDCPWFASSTVQRCFSYTEGGNERRQGNGCYNNVHGQRS